MSSAVDQKSKGQQSRVQNGLVTNSKETVNDEDFDTYLQQQQQQQQQNNQGYSSGPSSMAPPSGDPYPVPSYYNFYLNSESNVGGSNPVTTWPSSNTTTTADAFNNFYGYPGDAGGAGGSYVADNFFAQPGTTPPYLNPQFNFFPGNGDFATWGSAGGSSSSLRSSYYNNDYGYHRPSATAPVSGPVGHNRSGGRGVYGGGSLQPGELDINGYGQDGGSGLERKAAGVKAVEQGIVGLNIGDMVEQQQQQPPPVEPMGGLPTAQPVGGVADKGVMGDAKVPAAAAAPGGDSSRIKTATPPASSTMPAASVAAVTTSATPAPAAAPPAKLVSWASIASKPAKPQPKLKPKSTSHVAPVPAQLPAMKNSAHLDIGTWNGGAKNPGPGQTAGPGPAAASGHPQAQAAPAVSAAAPVNQSSQGKPAPANVHGKPAQQQQQQQHQQQQQQQQHQSNAHAGGVGQQQHQGGVGGGQQQQANNHTHARWTQQQRGGSRGGGGDSNSYSNVAGGSAPGHGAAGHSSNGMAGLTPITAPPQVARPHPAAAAAAPAPAPHSAAAGPHHPLLQKLRLTNLYNPKEPGAMPKVDGARFFVIKSYSEDDIHRSIKYSIWCSTEHGNKRLDAAWHERNGKGPIYFFFSVNGSGHFCGIGEMRSEVDYSTSTGVWAQDKWKGRFEVRWIYVKDVPNSQLRHIRLENNENKPVTNSRDTQEVPPDKGKQVMRIIHNYKHTTSIFDDFGHYEKRQEEDNRSKAKKGGDKY